MYLIARLVALVALILLIDGAVVTGDAAGTPPVTTGIAQTVHPFIGSLLALLTLILAVQSVRARAASALRWLIFFLVVIVVAQGGLGSRFGMDASPTWVGTLHAFLAQVFFAGSVAAISCTSPGWQQGPELVEDYGWPSLRSLAISTPVVLLFQVWLGAGLRHKAMGALSHIGFAMLAALWVLLECVFVIQQFPKHRSLRPAANALLAITFTQVFLGIATFTLRTMDMTGFAMSAVAAAHVTTGAITLAVAVALSIQIRRNVMPKGSLTAATT